MFESFSSTSLLAFLPAMTYNLPYFGEINLDRIVAAATIFIGLTLIFWFIRMVVLIRLKSLARKTAGELDDTMISVVENIRTWVYTLVALYIALQFFTFSEIVEKIIDGIFLFVIVWQGIEIATGLIGYFTSHFLEKDEDGDGQIDPNSATASNMVALISKIVLWALGFLFVLSNLGIEVTSLIAGLGIGGIAVAFALQGVLGDLFASFSIYFDKPFRIGDFIVVGNDIGTVEKIGIKSTRLRTLQGEQLVISNAELTTARVQNFKKMEERRIVMNFGITYETPHDLVKQVNGIVERIFDSIGKARLDLVHFTSFGDSALIFEVVYYVESSVYSEYLDIQQEFNFELMDKFSELGIEFAYPTQTIYTKTV